LSRHVVTSDEAGKRVDAMLAKLSGVSRSFVAGELRGGKVLVNGIAVKPSYTLVEGDAIDFDIRPRPPLTATAEAIEVPIVYEDGDVIVVDKPAGMVTHPAHGRAGGTLVNALLAHTGGLPGDAIRPGLVQRLDRDTSGLLVIAKTDDALRALSDAMKARQIHREYLGLVVGIPEHVRGAIRGPIGRDPRNRFRYAIVTEGKLAVTQYAIRERYARNAELLFSLETGRTHQIRVHMAAMHHPIVNDPIYGHEEPELGLPGQALHAWRLRFEHPRTHEPMQFEAPPPPAYLRARTLLAAR
jgi:23S rRNA pseudouridine1911/1915/1917 synthase